MQLHPPTLNLSSRNQTRNHLRSCPESELEYYVKNPFVSLEDEYKKIALKLNRVQSRSKAVAQSLVESGSPTKANKVKGILDISTQKRLENPETLLGLLPAKEETTPEPNNVPERVQKSTPESQKPGDELQKTQQDPKNKGINFESYVKVQRQVDRTILDTVEEIENNLTLLPEKRRKNRIVQRLSSISVQADNPAFTNKLPQIIATATLESFSPNRLQSREKQKKTVIDLASPKNSPKKKALAGFQLNRRLTKPKYKLDVIEKDAGKTGFNFTTTAHPRVKGLSNQYLFNLTQHNNSSFGPNSPKNFERSVLTSFPSPSFFEQHDGSHRGQNSTVEPSFAYLTKGLSITKNKFRSNSLSKEVTGGFGKGLKSPSAAQTRLLSDSEEEDDGKDKMIYEGMGLLTLYKNKNCSVRTIGDFKPDYFQIPVAGLSWRDMNYVHKKTGMNLKHQLFDKLLTEKDLIKFESGDMKELL